MTTRTPSNQYRLASPHDQHAPPPRPVRWAVMLLWSSLAFSVAQYLIAVPAAFSALPALHVARAAAIFGLTMPIFLYLFDAYLNIKILHRKNWARIVKLLMVLTNLLFQLVLPFMPGALEVLSIVIMNVLGLAALCLLFTTPAQLWYRQ